MYTMRGSPEVQVFEAVPAEGISAADLKGKLDALVYDVGFKTAMKNKWIQLAKPLIIKKVKLDLDFGTWALYIASSTSQRASSSVISSS